MKSVIEREWATASTESLNLAIKKWEEKGFYLHQVVPIEAMEPTSKKVVTQHVLLVFRSDNKLIQRSLSDFLPIGAAP